MTKDNVLAYIKTLQQLASAQFVYGPDGFLHIFLDYFKIIIISTLSKHNAGLSLKVD